ncbi:MAG: TerC family protein [Geminicoccaceae bacterium]|nr:TerC family protein [Geminicoccaceae bacterium]MCB9945538.1 TerC family protein [Geminicoccaceae bacterium]
MLALVNDPAVWASFGTLVLLEIILGVDNIIFISIIAGRLPEEQRPRARYLGLSGALVMRIILLASITWIMGLTATVFSAFGIDFSWRDLILLGGGLFLIYKATGEIYAEVEGNHIESNAGGQASFSTVILQIIVVDLVFSIDSVITAVGIADHLEVMIAAVIISVLVMMVAATPIAAFIEKHPSTKMLALAFLVMVGMALMADGAHFHVERGFIYAAMVFSLFVEAMNLLRGKRARKRFMEP